MSDKDLLGKLSSLTRALQAQTQAINRLAASNEAIVDAMVGEEEPDPDAQPTHYMDGSQVQ